MDNANITKMNSFLSAYMNFQKFDNKNMVDSSAANLFLWVQVF